MKAVIYARYSSDNQTEKSIEGQIQENREFAKRNGIEIVREYIDRAISGKKEGRPGFQQMIEDSKKGEFEAVIVWKIDRFARDRYIFAVYKTKLKKHGVKVISAMENIDTNTPEGAMFEGILESWAEYYSTNLSQNVKRGMNLQKQAGKYLGGPVPFGFEIDRSKNYIINQIDAEYVRKIFDMFLSGSTRREITDYLIKNKIIINKSTPKPNMIDRILRNKKYIGIYESGNVWIDNAMDPIVDKDVFYATQEMLDARKYKNKKDSDFALSGKLVCGECGSLYKGTRGTSHTGKSYTYYKCNKLKNKQCKCKPLPKREFEEYIARITATDINNDEVLEYIARSMYELYMNSREDISVITSLESQLSNIKRSLNNFVNAIANGIYNESTQAKMLELEEEKKKLERDLAIAKIKNPDITQDDIEYSLYRIFKNNNVNAIIDMFVKSIIINKNGLEITYTGVEESFKVRLSQKWCTSHNISRTLNHSRLIVYPNLTFSIIVSNPFYNI